MTIDLDTVDLSRLEAALETDKGTLKVRFYPDVAPAHVRNFCSLALQGFYDDTAFHRVIRNFMIQGGCPNTKPGAKGIPGTGGPGHRVQAEFNDKPHKRGVLSMARSADPNSAGSQFFIVHADHAEHLDRNYTAFGEVTEGLDVVDAIASVECVFSPNGERSQPKQRVGLKTVRIYEVPAEAPAP
ncbi:MAG TPA: peptidylprolyl isomerase [Planctomycetota bacterium]|nr:peptidylprolyl isomerase [Planctomycetota bacterium]